MSLQIPVVKPISQIKLAPGSTVTIEDVSWQEFESILEELGEKRSARLAYYRGILQIMVPLPEHEIPKDIISDIVKLLLKSTGKKYQPFGSTTFKQEGIAGIEPDACFYIDNYRSVIGCRRLQSNDPPPDLAIEIDITSKTNLDAYQVLGVPEVWIYDTGKLTIYLLEDGKYLESNTSPIFPNILMTQIIPQAIARSWLVGSCQAIEELESAIATSRQ